MFDVRDISKDIFAYCNSALSGHHDIHRRFREWWHISSEVRLEIVMPCVLELAITSKNPVQVEIISAIVISAFSFHLIDDFEDNPDAEKSLMLQSMTCQKLAQNLLSKMHVENGNHNLLSIYNDACQEILDGMQYFKSVMHSIDNIETYEAAMMKRTGRAYGAIGELICGVYDLNKATQARIYSYCSKMGLIIQAFNDYNDTFLKVEGNDLMKGRINIPILMLDALTQDSEIKDAIAHRQMMPLFYKIKAAMAHYNIRNLVIEKAFKYRCDAVDELWAGSDGLKLGLLADFMDATFTTYLILNRSDPDQKLFNYEEDKQYMSTALYLKRSLN